MNSFTRRQITVPQQTPSLCTGLYMQISQDQESAVNKNRPDNVLLFCLCEKVHECNYVHYPAMKWISFLVQQSQLFSHINSYNSSSLCYVLSFTQSYVIFRIPCIVENIRGIKHW